MTRNEEIPVFKILFSKKNETNPCQAQKEGSRSSAPRVIIKKSVEATEISRIKALPSGS